MTNTLPASKARIAWSEILDQAIAGDTTEITRNGRPVAALVSIELLRAFEQYEDLEDARLVEKSRAESTRTYTHDEAMQIVFGDE